MRTVRRVLLVVPQEGARWRSIAAYAESLRLMLESAGVEVGVVEAPWFNPPSIAKGVAARWHRQPAMLRAASTPFDVVHLTDQALAHHARRFLGNAAVVVSCHDLMPFTTPGYYAPGFEGPLKRFFLRRSVRALKRADTIIAVSAFTAGEVETFAKVPAERIRVVPNVVRPGFRPVAREEAEALLAATGVDLPAGLRVLSVGNDRAYKNLPVLFEALADPALAGASIVRVGPLTKAHEQDLVRLSLNERVTRVSGLDDGKLAALCSACDVLAQPSIAEGFGIPVIEAMACGLPVVVSDGGALPEVAGGAATVVPLAGGGFAQRLALALNEAAASRAARAPIGIVRAREFSPERVVPKLLAAYEDALVRRVARA